MNMEQYLKSNDQEPIVSSLLDEDPELLELVTKFVERLPEQLSDINDAVKENNWAELKRKVHDLKGLGGNFGFPVISQVAKQIEDEIRAQSFTNIPPLLQELNSLYQRIRLGQNNP